MGGSRQPVMGGDMRKIVLALAACAFAVSAACASAQAKTPPARPNLEVPPAPPRVIEAPPPPEPALPDPVSELPASMPTTPRPRPPVRETQKPETKPAEPPPAEPPAAPPAAVVATVPPLRTPGTPDPAGASRQVRDILDRAKKTLGSIDYQRLNPARRGEYDRANLMIKEAEEAVKSEKFDYAKNLADKADQIAKELQGG